MRRTRSAVLLVRATDGFGQVRTIKRHIVGAWWCISACLVLLTQHGQAAWKTVYVSPHNPPPEPRTIQEAINYPNPEGYDIVFLIIDGPYIESPVFNRDTEGHTFVFAAGTYPYQTLYGNFTFGQAENVVLLRLTIKGQVAFSKSGAFMPRNNAVVSCSLYGLDYHSTEKNTVDSCIISGYVPPVRFRGSSLKLLNSRITCTASGQPGVLSDSLSVGLLIRNCEITASSPVYLIPNYGFSATDDSLVCNRIATISGGNIGVTLVGVSQSKPALRTVIIGNHIVGNTEALETDYHQDTKVLYNTCLSPASGSFVYYDGYGVNLEMRNNVFYLGSNNTVYQRDAGSGTFVSDNNCFFKTGATTTNLFNENGTPLSWTQWRTLGRDANGINQNPLLTSTVSPYDFHLQSGSPCLGKAASITDITHDYDGDLRSTGAYVSPDMGCDEFAPMAFNLTTPVDNATNQEVENLTLTWQASKNATGYDIYYGTPDLPSSPNIENHPSTTVQISGLEYYKQYVWRVVAKYQDHKRNCNTDFHFTTKLPPPPADFNLASPIHGAGNQPVTGVVFDWDDATGIGVTYSIYVSLDPANPPAEPPVKSGLTASTWTYDLVTPLAHSKEYYWNVKASNISGSRWSLNGNFNFTTVPERPEAFELTTPANGTSGQPVTGKLKWTVAERAVTYDIYLKQDGEPVEPDDKVGTVAAPTTEFSYDGLVTYGRQYHWYVKAVNPGGETRSTSVFNFGTVAGLTGWQEVRSMPKTPTDKAPKDGAWMALHAAGTDANPVIYVAKGNKTTDFYMYNPTEGDSGTWHVLESIPRLEGERAKPPSKGCVGVSDGERYVYMTKGNNTQGFWRYDVVGNVWEKRALVPLGADGKRVKGGNDIVYVPGGGDTGYVFLLKGGKTSFYKYNTKTDEWDSTLPNVPGGGGKEKYDKGSFLVYDDEHNCLYAHQAKYNDGTNHYMFKYDLGTGQWQTAPLKGMPLAGLQGGSTKDKKSKDGGAGAWYDGGLYALKGGNTQHFYRYAPESNSWAELETVPGNGSAGSKKYVKAGGDLVSYGGGAFFALKGNKTHEFWRYMQGTPQASSLKPQARSGVQAGKSAVGSLQLAISPNPIATGFVTLRYSLPKPGSVVVTVFDVAGRVVQQQMLAGNRAGAVALDLRKLASGIYLVRLDASGCSQTQKLVVQR